MAKGKEIVEQRVFSKKDIAEKIMVIREKHIIIEGDLADIYGVTVKRMNEQVRRNIERFPERFRFQLTDIEKEKVVANCDHLSSLRFSYVNPYAYSEQGVAMLSTVLRSETAIGVSIDIMDAFVEMRKFISTFGGIMQRMEGIERKQLEMQLETDTKFEQVFSALEEHTAVPKQGIFFDGQIFDAYVLASNMIESAEKSIVLIDNYVDEQVLLLLSKRKAGVSATIYTLVNRVLIQDVQRHNMQYPAITVKQFNRSHDRFLIVDDVVYHIGASLKDLGKKWFGFSRMAMEADKILSEL